MQRLNIPEQYINFISSFSKERRAQVVYLNPHIEQYVIQGYPQGSCLEPFLCNALIGTLLSMYLDAKHLLIAYADDLLLFTSGSSCSILKKERNAALTSIEEWPILNNIQNTIDKISWFTFGKPTNLKHPPIFKIYNPNLKNVNCLKYFGVTLYLWLSFYHI